MSCYNFRLLAISIDSSVLMSLKYAHFYLFYFGISDNQHALSGNAKVKPFEPSVTCKQECMITTFQEVYFISESFEDAKEKMR